MLRVTRKQNAAGGRMTVILGLVVVFMVWLYITPIVTHEVDSLIFKNASAWNFTAHEGAEAILGLSGFVWVVSGIMLLIGGTFAAMKWEGD